MSRFGFFFLGIEGSVAGGGAPDIDRSRFTDRELFDPARVMERSSGGGHLPGQHTEGNLDFLKKPVDLGVSTAQLPTCAPCATSAGGRG